MGNIFGNIGGTEMFILLIIVLIIFGPKRLPGLGKAIGKSIREFKDGMKGIAGDDEPEEARPASSMARSAEEARPAAATPAVPVSHASPDEQAKPS